MRKLSTKPRVIDLFSGAGLFSHAFEKVGFDIIQAVEIDPWAAWTYSENVGHHIAVGDITKIPANGKCDVLIGGPPCQGFSTLGRMDPSDPRNQLGMQMVKWASITKPSIVVIENVAAFLDSPAWSRIRSGLIDQGYIVSSIVLNAADYGVAQIRNRSFTFASKIGPINIPRPQNRQLTTVREAWIGLSNKPDGLNHHIAPIPTPEALARMRLIPEGGDKRHIMEKNPRLAPESWWKIQGYVTDVWGRMRWDAPSNTLRTCLQNPSKGRYIHPQQHRVITLREAARLHSIPDHWKFFGKSKHISKQIGNSVPPLLGKTIARAVLSALN